MTEFDLGHIVRFRRPEPDPRGVRMAKGVLLECTPATYLRGLMPQPGFLIRVSLTEGAANALGKGSESHGPLPAGLRIDILELPRWARSRQQVEPARSQIFSTQHRLVAQQDSVDLTDALERLRQHIARTQK